MLHQIRFTSQKIAKFIELIEHLYYRRRKSLEPFHYKTLNNIPSSLHMQVVNDESGWNEVPPNRYWGEANVDFVMRGEFQIPAEWGSEDPTALFLPIGKAGNFSHPEALVYIDDEPYAACDRHHQEILLRTGLNDGAVHQLVLHGWTGSQTGGREIALRMGQPELVQIHQPTRDFIALARVALGIAEELTGDNPTRAHLLTALDQAFKLLDTREPFGENFYASVDEAAGVLQQGIEAAGPSLDVDITAVGHAHIDLAWLWTLAQTRRKAGRTFHNVLRLMEKFPDYRFVQSQAQLYEYVRQDYPELFQAISQKVEDGQWEAIGGMWVEADCNISGGEALARQFLLGHQFFEQYFGAGSYTPVLWLPDVFGFPWSLPQLAKEAGIQYFFSIKLGWSQYNRFPYDSFLWQGIDGTRLLTHFSTTIEKGASHASTYNAKATPYEALSTWRNFQQKDWGAPGQTPPLLMVYGHGDGGGGPTYEMLENIRLMGDFPATPRVTPGRVGDFFEKLEGDMGEVLPVWNGELYLEYHRGTYTSQARSKRANRKSEFSLHDAEFLAVYAMTLDNIYSYPHEMLHRAWELLCLNQFHDILPGTSIGDVYEDSLIQYREVFNLGHQVRDEALLTISQHLGGDLLVINPSSFDRSDLVVHDGVLPPGVGLQRADGHKVAVQNIEGGLVLDVGTLPPYSVAPLKFFEVPIKSETHSENSEVLHVSVRHLENDYLRVELNDSGEITRIYDNHNQREVLPQGTVANQFQAFEDRSITPDAWEIDISYDDKMWLTEPAESIEVIERGPLRVGIEIHRRMLHSQIIQRIFLSHDSPRLDFETRIDWHERHILLKAAFPVEILSPYATYDIQWGSIQRPTHRNTSWDLAKFEVPAHKWIDLSEGGYGVSLLNDCKYGHDVHENVMRISLLRGPTYPHPQADLGEHRFTYSLYPHGGSSLQNTIRAAYALNDPLFIWAVEKPVEMGNQNVSSFLSVDHPNIVIETIKAAEDGLGLIVRLYENQARRGVFKLTTAFKLNEAWRTNLLEKNQSELELGDNYVMCTIRPYQIITLRLIPA